MWGDQVSNINPLKGVITYTLGHSLPAGSLTLIITSQLTMPKSAVSDWGLQKNFPGIECQSAVPVPLNSRLSPLKKASG